MNMDAALNQLNKEINSLIVSWNLFKTLTVLSKCSYNFSKVIFKNY